jgi:hypothetical protein
MVVASIRSSVDNGFSVFFAWIPHLLGAIAVLLIGWIVAKAVGKLVSRVTQRAGLDRAVHGGPGGNMVQRVVSSPSRLVGTIVFWAILLATISLAASVLGIAALTAFVGAVIAYLPNVIAAFLIFLVAGAISAAIAGVVTKVMGDTSLGKIVATAAPILIMTIATFMILDQLKIAHNIVVITYAALLGAIALGSALAFGLGGREVAAQILQGAQQSVQENKDEWKQDLDQGISRGKDEAEKVKEKTSDGAGDEHNARTAVSYRPAESS